jgi:signal transduction histidine kinase/ActR/RegA family two-component response regulator
MEMEKGSAPLQRRVLVYMAHQEPAAVLQSVLSEQQAEGEICRDVAGLCGSISDKIDAVIIGSDLLSESTIQRIAAALDMQPEWSDLPIVIAGAGGPDSPVAVDALRPLGNVLLLDSPFTPATARCTLQAAFRNRETQRRIQQTMQALHESRNQLDQKVRDRTRELAERAAQLRKLTGELILSEQHERRRVARILHDHLQQLLVSAKYRISSLNRIEDPIVKMAIQGIEELLSEAIEASRSLTSELSPPIVHESGLRTAMEWLVSFMAAQNGLTVQLKMKEDMDQIEENAKVLLFESTRELLLNVVKHAQVRSAEVNVRKVEENILEVAVSDQGVGFNPAFPKHSGFGLVRIRERLKLIGGSLEIRSSLGRGSHFTIMAPLSEPRTAVRSMAAGADARTQAWAPSPRTEKPISGTIRILIADDHAVMRQGLSTSLSQEPDMAIVGEAEDGEAALERTRSLRPDVVLMDLGMPKMNGIEATQRIHSEMPKVRVIGLSMFEEKEGARAMLEVGAVAYLSKSCSVDALTTAIRRSVGKPE